jgi:hypothetical protein
MPIAWLTVDRKSGAKFLMFYAEWDIENRHNECRLFVQDEPGRIYRKLKYRRTGN